MIEKRNAPPYPEERIGQKLIVKVIKVRCFSAFGDVFFRGTLAIFSQILLLVVNLAYMWGGGAHQSQSVRALGDFTSDDQIIYCKHFP